MNIEAGEGYRLLQIGETILEGDEFSTAARHPTGWSRVVSNFGYVVQPFHMPVRRKHPAPAPAAPEPDPPPPGYGAAEMAADRYVESMALSLERSNARRDFMAGWGSKP